MKRRTFFKTTSALVAGTALWPISCRQPTESLSVNSFTFPLNFDLLKSELVKINDDRIPTYQNRQILDKSHEWYGAFYNPQLIPNPSTTGGMIRGLVCSYVSPSSQNYRSSEIAQSIERGLDYLLKAQHNDGTIDLYSTNFHSTPDTGFVVNWLAPVQKLLSQLEDEKASSLAQKLLLFLERAGEALAIGGIHTPNHRWVVSAALSWIHNLTDPNKQNDKYTQRIDQWLGEGIDIDPDGQYTEKSAFTYSPICNRAFIMMSRLLNREDLLEPVRRNLAMTLYYAHPNGEIVTEASGRQDKYRIGRFASYYYPFRYMAIKDNNEQFAAMCKMIEKDSLNQLPSYLNYILEDELVQQNLPTPAQLPNNYEKHFTYSKMVRIRREEIDATILADNPTFFTFFKQDAVLQAVRLASAFFGAGQFNADEVKKEGNSYVLAWELTKPYYQLFPVAELPDDGDWEKMPRDKRLLSEVQTMKKEIRITENNGQFEIDIKVTGTDRVPVTLELAFRHGGTLSGVQKIDHTEDAYLLKEKEGKYTFKNNSITFGGGQAEHEWIELRGALEKSDAMCVYLTGYTPFQQKLLIR